MTGIFNWIMAAFAVVGGFVVAGVAGSVLTDFAGFWHLPGAGFSAALATVALAYLAAPNHKLSCAFGALIIGAAVAWYVLEPSWLPENYGDRGAYEPTHLPIIATYVGGVVGLLLVALYRRWAGPNNSFKPKPLRGSA